MNLVLRQCSPGEKTKAFAVVLASWDSLKFDPVGNAKAAEIVKNLDKKTAVQVVVTGERAKSTIRVDSITQGTK
ncbi:MAG: hypothetical protein WDO73_09495 [Ignavibacteriota bacterium]